MKPRPKVRSVCQTTTGDESRIILDRGGAEQLNRIDLCLTNGGGLYPG
ncbi:MAG: hypothetical protein GQ526_10300 [Ardenticatenales bacterium]|nr:hypothetical protein [Ardenticatenales bacterium]